MEQKTREFVAASSVFEGGWTYDAAFHLQVAVEVAQSTPVMSYWLDVAQSTTKVWIPQKQYNLPDGIDADTVFLLAARTALGQTQPEPVIRGKLDAILDKLHGTAEVHTADRDGVHRDWPNTFVTLSLPPWRLLQFRLSHGNQMFFMFQIGCS